MRVAEIINALIGVPGDIEIEVCDDAGIAAEMLRIEIKQSNGNTYGVAVIDREILADDETAVKS